MILKCSFDGYWYVIANPDEAKSKDAIDVDIGYTLYYYNSYDFEKATGTIFRYLWGDNVQLKIDQCVKILEAGYDSVIDGKYCLPIKLALNKVISDL